jgi:hypothetical protein
MLTSYFLAPHLRDQCHVSLLALVSLLSGSKPTRHHPQQQEIHLFDLHPEHEDPTMLTRRQKQASGPRACDGD